MDEDSEDLGLTPEQLDRFWEWLKTSGAMAGINAMLASAPQDKEPGRNEQCWCGSGLKYKKCCLEGGSI